MSAYEAQQARKRNEIDYGPWDVRRDWIVRSRLTEERRAIRFENGSSIVVGEPGEIRGFRPL